MLQTNASRRNTKKTPPNSWYWKRFRDDCRTGLTDLQIAALRWAETAAKWRQAQPGNPEAIKSGRAAVVFSQQLGGHR